jgi:hypothetical protein
METDNRFAFRAAVSARGSSLFTVLALKDVNAFGEQMTFGFTNPYFMDIDPERYASHPVKVIVEDKPKSATE